MGKIAKIFFGFFLLLVIFLTYFEATEPQRLNWTPSYTATDKIPLGSFVFYESWKEVETRKFQSVQAPPFEKLSDSLENGTYFFLNNAVNFDNNELHKILEWVARGNRLFISARKINETLLDTLHLETRILSLSNDLSSIPKLNFEDHTLRSAKDFKVKKEFVPVFFHQRDSSKVQVLGNFRLTQEDNPLGKKPNFIRANFGQGIILLHSMPEAFGNYFLLNENNYEYAEKILAYLDSEKILFWDSYYKAGKTFYSSPLYVLLSNNRLKWAYYFVLIGSLLFIIFEGKRKQRVIPIVNPLKNQSYQYARTIGDLYLEQEQYTDLIHKKIELFLAYIRKHYRLSTKVIDEEFHTLLAAKSGNSISEGKNLLKKMERLANSPTAGKAEFFELSEDINNFKSKKNGKSHK